MVYRGLLVVLAAACLLSGAHADTSARLRAIAKGDAKSVLGGNALLVDKDAFDGCVCHSTFRRVPT